MLVRLGICQLEPILEESEMLESQVNNSVKDTALARLALFRILDRYGITSGDSLICLYLL